MSAPMALEWDDVTVRYRAGRGWRTVLQDVVLRVAPGEWVNVTGPSGAGKTTLFRLAYGALRPSTGSVRVFGEDIRSRPIHLVRRGMGLIFQSFELLQTKSALANVAYGAEVLGAPPREARARALEALCSVGLADAADRLPHELSGGEQQRVGIARALIHRPPIILADEPTGNLDRASARLVFELLRRVHEEWSPAMLVATHSRDLVEWSGGRVVHVAAGRVTAP